MRGFLSHEGYINWQEFEHNQTLLWPSVCTTIASKWRFTGQLPYWSLLFIVSQAWSFVQRGAPLRHSMQTLHVSLGLLLAAVLLGRVAWRLGPGRRVLPAATGLVELASSVIHYALYCLLAAEVALGLCFRWAQGEPLSFFGVFAIPSLYPFVKEQAGIIGTIHYWVGTVITILAGLHATAALFHHFILRDGVLLRMLPAGRARGAEPATPALPAVAREIRGGR